MYHAIGSAPAGTPYRELYVAPSVFAAEIRWLASNGYRAVTMQQVYDAWTRGTPLPKRPVVLTFDDGYPGDVTTALPLLRTRRWPGVLNLQVGNLVPARVRELIRSGWEVDAHTFTHPDLTTVDAARLRREVVGSRVWIRGVFHVPCNFFAYPAGRYDGAVVAEVRAAGFLAAETTNGGYARSSQGLFTLDRIRVSASDGVAGLAEKLSGA